MCEKYLPVLDLQLSETAYLAGNKMTIADIGLLAQLDARG
ncbi:MAG: glutathione S-transferase family protein [Candidatus Omnitrophica bacterium]|nr:glutathione S-transferase family protein [Candidatus Omnitrophota bacterium]